MSALPLLAAAMGLVLVHWLPPKPVCVVTEASLNALAGPPCATSPGVPTGYVWTYHCGTPAQVAWRIEAGCVVEVLP